MGNRIQTPLSLHLQTGRGHFRGTALFVTLSLVLVCLAGCGQKGPLKLPAPNAEASVEEGAAREAPSTNDSTSAP